jgi:hypothetical protein
VIVAKMGDEVIGTMSIIRDNPLGLPMDKIFDLSEIRSKNCRLAEVSSLAVKKSHRHSDVYFPLTQYLTQYSMNQLKLDDWVIAVNPSMAAIYEHLFAFEKLTEKVVDNYNFVRGAPAVGFYTKIEGLKNRLKELNKDNPIKNNAFHYLFEYKRPGLIYPEKKSLLYDYFQSSTWLDYFMIQKTQSLLKATESEIKKILTFFKPLRTFDSLMPLQVECLRSQFRFDVAIPSTLVINDSVIIGGETQSVSWKGFSFKPKNKLEISVTDIIRLRLPTLKGEMIDVRGIVRHIGQGNIIGCELSTISNQWNKMIGEMNHFISVQELIQAQELSKVA